MFQRKIELIEIEMLRASMIGSIQKRAMLAVGRFHSNCFFRLPGRTLLNGGLFLYRPSLRAGVKYWLGVTGLTQRSAKGSIQPLKRHDVIRPVLSSHYFALVLLSKARRYSYSKQQTQSSPVRLDLIARILPLIPIMQSPHPLIVEPVGLEVDKLPKPLSFPELFGNDHPVEIEIGTGKGTFLLEAAKAHSEINYLGIEWARWYWRYASDRLRRHACLNARTVRAEAVFFLQEFIPPATISVLHIYFPDPWPKKRHHKRRLIQPPFMELVERILIPGGRVQIVTDHQDYFEQIESVVKGSKLKIIDYNRPGSAAEGEFVGTNFERKYKREGRPFYALAATKVNRPPFESA